MDQPNEQLQDLYTRRAVCQQCIRVADQAAGDPRRLDALAKYQAQLASIDAKIAAITGTPPPVVVGLKAASLFGTAHK